MSPEEQKDLDAMKAKVIELKLSCYDMMLELSRMDVTSLGHCGHRNGLPAALESTLKSTMKDIKKLHDSHIRKYPD